MREQAEDARLRAPLAAAVLVAVLAIGSGFVLERSLGTRPLAVADVPPETSGAWLCPHGGGARWKAWVVMANPSREVAEVRVATYGSGAPSTRSMEVPPGEQLYAEVPATEMSSGTAVDYFGGTVAVGMVSSRDGGRGVAAEPCTPSAGRTWFLAEGTTERGFAQRLVVMNPFVERAVFDVSLVGDDERIRPGDLTGVVLPPRRTMAFNLGDHALGKRTLGAVVTVHLGKVAAAGLGLTEGGVRAALGVPAPALQWILPGAADGRGTEVTMLAPARAAVPFRVRAQNAEEQVELVGEADLKPVSADTLDFEVQGWTLVVAADGREPFLAARRLLRGNDLASTAGAPEGASRWVALPAADPDGATSLLVVENPGDEVAEVGVTLLTAGGRAEAPSIARLVLAGGRAQIVSLEDLVGREPVSVLVEAAQGTVVVAQVAYSDRGFAVATGVPLDPLG